MTIPNDCLCGCGDQPSNPRSEFLPGHDRKLEAKLAAAVGGLANLKRIVEAHLGHPLD